MSPFASQTREAFRNKFNGSVTEGIICDTEDAVRLVGRKIDKMTDPVTEPVSRQIKKVTTSVSVKREQRRTLKAIRKAQVEKELLAQANLKTEKTA